MRMRSPLPPAHLPAHAQELVRACLSHDPSERPSAQQIMEQVWSCLKQTCAMAASPQHRPAVLPRCLPAPSSPSLQATLCWRALVPGRLPSHGMQVQALLEGEGGAELGGDGAGGAKVAAD